MMITNAKRPTKQQLKKISAQVNEVGAHIEKRSRLSPDAVKWAVTKIQDLLPNITWVGTRNGDGPDTEGLVGCEGGHSCASAFSGGCEGHVIGQCDDFDKIPGCDLEPCVSLSQCDDEACLGEHTCTGTHTCNEQECSVNTCSDQDCAPAHNVVSDDEALYRSSGAPIWTHLVLAFAEDRPTMAELRAFQQNMQVTVQPPQTTRQLRIGRRS